jgi:hypothetical protein
VKEKQPALWFYPFCSCPPPRGLSASGKAPLHIFHGSVEWFEVYRDILFFRHFLRSFRGDYIVNLSYYGRDCKEMLGKYIL